MFIQVNIFSQHFPFLSSIISSSMNLQEVPNLAGFISVTGVKPSRKSTIDNYALIDQPISVRDSPSVTQTIRGIYKGSREATSSEPLRPDS